MKARRLGAYLLAVLVAYVLATVSATQHVAGSLESMDVEVGAGTRLAMIGHDLIGMTSSFLPLVALGLLIAFLVAALIVRRAQGLRLLLYPLAGAVAVVCVHLALKAAFGITAVAAARTLGGLAMQALAGAVGGYVFARLGRPRAAVSA